MDKNTVIVIGIFALVLIVAFLAFRKRVKAEVSGPLNTKLKLDATNPPPALGVSVNDAKSRAGGLRAEDFTGRGTSVKGAEVQQDIIATSRGPEENSDPKT